MNPYDPFTVEYPPVTAVVCWQSEPDLPTPARNHTWGSIKSIYR